MRQDMGTKIPKIYSVGNDDQDFTPEAIELLTMQIRDWFVSEECDRTYSDPYAEARAKVEQCLQATTAKGKPWFKAPKTFEARIKIKTLFDMEEGNHVSQERAKTVTARANKAHADAVDAAGSSPVTSTHIQDYQKKVELDILSEYPELDTPVHRPNVMRLALLYSEQERIRIEMPGSKDAVRIKKIDTLSTLQRSITDTMKSLDIYPDQIRKRMDKQREGSVGDLVALVDEDPDFKAREKRWALTMALQLWWMTQHPNGNKTGPQLHDFEMWHLTRTRPINYTCKCGESVLLVEGFTPNELRDYLIENGVLVEKPLIPQLYSEEDLDGLAAYGSSSEPTIDDDAALGVIDEGGDTVSEGI